MNTQQDEHDRAMVILFRAVLGQAIEQTDWRAARSHMIRCGACWERFQRIAETLTGEPILSREEPLPLPEAPTFGERWRLYRHAPRLKDRPGHWQSGLGYLARLVQEAEQRTVALLISVGQLLAGQDLVPAHRGTEHLPEAEITLHCAELPDLEATVIIIPDMGDSRLVRVAVEISLPSRWPDFSGVRVIMDDGEQELERVTGRDGRLEFGAIPRERVPRLSFIVLPP